MNLVELSEELEFMPKDALIQLSQNPNSNYPPYLVLAEIQRRTQMEKMYAAARPKPQNTVAEEVVTDFAMSTPNAGISMMDGSAPTERFSPKSSDIPAPVLMQTAANGGLTGFLQDRYYGDDGRFNVGTALLDASMVIPGVGILGGLGRGAYFLGRAGLRKLAERQALQKQGLLSKSGQKIKDFYAPRVRSRTEGGPRILDPRNAQGSAAQQLGLVDAKGRLTGEALSKGLDAGRKLNYNRVLGTAALSGLPLSMIGGASGEDVVTTEALPDERELTAEEKELLRLQNEMAMAETKTKSKGFDDQALNLISLGGTIMGARNLSELGQGLTSFATAKQGAKGDEAQQAYYAASAAKAQAEVENMPLDRVLSSIEAITEQQEAALENNDTDTATALGLQLQILNQRALELQGIDVKTQASIDKNLIASFGT